jgi:acetyl-CoA carboxylase carboxyl transferase subunit alpha
VLLMLSNTIYSVIPPEGCAAILWRDSSYGAQAAESLRLTAKALAELEVVDEVVEEPVGGAHANPQETGSLVKRALLKHLKRLDGVSGSRLVSRRFDKYARIGTFVK